MVTIWMRGLPCIATVLVGYECVKLGCVYAGMGRPRRYCNDSIRHPRASHRNVASRLTLSRRGRRVAGSVKA